MKKKAGIKCRLLFLIGWKEEEKEKGRGRFGGLQILFLAIFEWKEDDRGSVLDLHSFFYVMVLKFYILVSLPILICITKLGKSCFFSSWTCRLRKCEATVELSLSLFQPIWVSERKCAPPAEEECLLRSSKYIFIYVLPRWKYCWKAILHLIIMTIWYWNMWLLLIKNTWLLSFFVSFSANHHTVSDQFPFWSNDCHWLCFYLIISGCFGYFIISY